MVGLEPTPRNLTGCRTTFVLHTHKIIRLGFILSKLAASHPLRLMAIAVELNHIQDVFILTPLGKTVARSSLKDYPAQDWHCQDFHKLLAATKGFAEPRFLNAHSLNMAG
jgi:hypothetical protein